MNLQPLNIEKIDSLLNTSFAGLRIDYFEEIDSTNNFARRLAEDKIEEKFKNGAVVVAESQTKGRGKGERIWESQKMANILMTIILKKDADILSANTLNLLAAYVICEVLKELYGFRCEIKWPNDVLLNNKKIVGVLTESAQSPDGGEYLLVGIGLNVFQEKETFTNDLKYYATSLYKESENKNIVLSREEIVAGIINAIEKYYISYKAQWPVIMQKLKNVSSTIGSYVRIKSGTGLIEGTALDFEDDGGLIVRQDSGMLVTIYSGDVIEISWKG